MPSSLALKKQLKMIKHNNKNYHLSIVTVFASTLDSFPFKQHKMLFPLSISNFIHKFILFIHQMVCISFEIVVIPTYIRCTIHPSLHRKPVCVHKREWMNEKHIHTHIYISICRYLLFKKYIYFRYKLQSSLACLSVMFKIISHRCELSEGDLTTHIYTTTNKQKKNYIMWLNKLNVCSQIKYRK